MIIQNHSVYIRPDFIPQKNWAVFLDRDGVINHEEHLVYKLKDFKLIPQAASAIKKLNQANIPAIVVHNAAVVARNLCQPAQVDKLNQLMITQLASKKAFIDAIFYCPHHQAAFNPKMIEDCQWRKPRPGMLKAAAKQFKLNLAKSFIIGDTARDILAGQAVKATTILVKTGHAGKTSTHQAQPDKISQNILTAVNWLLSL